jgi:hypothetical protein
MKRYKLVKVEAKNLYFKIQKKGIMGWRNLRRIQAQEGVMWTELVTFKTEQEARDYIDNLKPCVIKETILEEFCI